MFTGPASYADFDYPGLEGGMNPDFHAISLDDYDFGAHN